MAHIHEKIDLTVGVYIVQGDAVLLRHHEKYKFWLDVGGHVELDEDPNQAAIREAKEEAGLDIKLIGTAPSVTDGEGYVELIPPRFMNRHRINEAHEHVDLIYFATADTRDIVPGEGEADVEIRWFTRAELDDPHYGIRETIKHYAKAALDAAAAQPATA